MKPNKLIFLLFIAILCLGSEHATAQLFVPNEIVADDEIVILPVSVTKPGFTAFQADVFVTDALCASDIELTIDESINATHQLITSMLSDKKIRVMIFSLNNALIPEDSPVCFLKINAGGLNEVITFSNIIMVDSHGVKISSNEVSTAIVRTELPKSFSASLALSNRNGNEHKAPSNIMLDISNNYGFTAFQADIIIPKYVSVQPHSIKMTGRANSSHYLHADLIDQSNILRVICVSLSNENFSGSSGTVIEIPIDGIELNGEYSVKAIEIKVSEIDGTLHNLDDCEIQFSVSESIDPDCELKLTNTYGNISVH